MDELTVGDYVWWEQKEGQEYLARVDVKYTYLVDLNVCPFAQSLIEGVDYSPKRIKQEAIRPAEVTEAQIDEAYQLARQVVASFRSAMENCQEAVDDKQVHLLHNATIHALLFTDDAERINILA